MSTTPKPFDPSAYGVAPADGGFDPSKYGVTPAVTGQTPPPTQQQSPSFLGQAKQWLSDFVNKPLIPYFANKAKEAGQLEQQKLNQVYGPEYDIQVSKMPQVIQPILKSKPVRVLNQIGGQAASLPYAGARVVYGALGMTPEDAAVLGASAVTGQPELAGGYFAAKGAAELPGQVKQAVQNPTPENVESALGTGATIAAGGAGALHGPNAGVPSIEQARSEMAANQAQLAKTGTGQKVARTVTGVRPALETDVTRAGEKQAKVDTAAAEKNAANQQKFQQETEQTTLENKAAEQALELRKQSEADLKAKTDAYYNKEVAAEAKADQANTENWNAWRQKTANVTVDPNAVLKTINDVGARFPEAKQVIQESLRSPDEMQAAESQYVADRSSVMKQQGYKVDYDSLPLDKKAVVDDLMNRLGITPPEGVAIDPTKPVPLQTIHELKSDIGWKLFRGEYPPTVTGAMKQVYGALQAAESRGSLEAGALPELEAARASHSAYQEAFGRSKPNRAYEGDVRMKGANPEAFGAQQEQERLAAVAKHDQSIPQAYRDVVAARENVEKLPTEDQLRKGLKQPPKEPTPIEPKQQTVDIQRSATKALQERAKNWGHFNARDIGILGASILAEPIIRMLSGHDAQGASNLLPVAAVAYEASKYAAANALRNPKIIQWLSKPPAEEIAAISRIPGADRIKIQNGLTQVVVDEFKKGNRVDLDPQVQAFLGPQNMAKIAAATTPKQSVKDMRDKVNAATQ